MTDTMQNIRPPRPPRPLGESVADRIEALLARCDRIRRGSECQRPTRFNAAGERHARAVAAQDSAVHCGPERSQPIPPNFTPSTEIDS